jgi:chaperonin GroEL (HSP60 family)
MPGKQPEFGEEAHEHIRAGASILARAAVEERVVPGGGVALIRAQQAARDAKLKGRE